MDCEPKIPENINGSGMTRIVKTNGQTSRHLKGTYYYLIQEKIEIKLFGLKLFTIWETWLNKYAAQPLFFGSIEAAKNHIPYVLEQRKFTNKPVTYEIVEETHKKK